MWVVQQLLATASQGDGAVFQHIATVRDTQCVHDVLLDDQYRGAQGEDLVDDAEHLRHQQR
ncbi:hypothetical protein D3C80_2143890 [compost metagenome]